MHIYYNIWTLQNTWYHKIFSKNYLFKKE